jgi:SPP1 family predicted phage head-tail adaptor
MSDAIFESLLNNWFVISRQEKMSDGQGGWLTSYVSIGIVRGRIRPASSSERQVAQENQRQITHVLYVLPKTDIARGDLVTCDGLAVDVQGVRDPSFAGHHLEVDCVETQRDVTQEAGS